MEQKRLEEILENHRKWMEGKGGKRADLRGADFRGADLRWANLQEANLQRANLRGADFRGADLRWANLQEANLQGADLRGADLRCSDLQWANLQEANLQGANLRRANLCGANLCGADLCGADLDYNCWPIWCGSLDVIVDKRIAAQLAYHFCRLVCDDPEVQVAQQAIKGLANQFHRVNECGVIGGKSERR